MGLISKFRSWQHRRRVLRLVVSDYQHLVSRTDSRHESLLMMVKDARFKADYATDIAKSAEAFIKDATAVHVDPSMNSKGRNDVVVCGRYKGRDYVRCFSVKGDNMDGLIDMLRGMERYARLERIDGFPIGYARMIRDAVEK